ncbi:flagellin [Sphingobium lactosutens]|uniref:flagellin n=1 Tax=Sphingobium lactosutens TaxID=522773 RepID=UPI0015C18282|nr:flagellin [Sphingobium lactosutens]NWK98888.1 flagellin [Sphingobium lactosutens]
MAFSVNTNAGAMAALQSLNATNGKMETTQSRINTGLAVGSTKDDSAKYTIAQTLRGDLGGLSAVSSSLNNAKSVTDTAIAGAEQISDILNQMKSKAYEAADDGLETDARAAIDKDFTALKEQITTIIKSSEFNNTNLLDSTFTGTTSVAALQSLKVATGTDTLDVANQAFDTSVDTAIGTGGINSQATAEAMVATIDTVISDVNTSLSDLGAASRKIEGQLSFTSKLSDVVTTGIGNLVDADLAKESANLQALQVQQQLGVQALSIANQAPQTILSLFR